MFNQNYSLADIDLLIQKETLRHKNDAESGIAEALAKLDSVNALLDGIASITSDNKKYRKALENLPAK